MLNKEEMAQRIRIIRDKFCEGNGTKMANMLGIKQQQANSLCNGKLGVGNKTLLRILQSFPDINEEWLVKGVGPMMKEEEEAVTADDVADAFVLSQSGAPHKIPMQFDVNGELIAQYEIRIAELKERIAELNARISQQERYIAILSEEHRDLVHQAIGKLDEGVDGIKLIQKKIC